jgi:hypothetical protein
MPTHASAAPDPLQTWLRAVAPGREITALTWDPAWRTGELSVPHAARVVWTRPRRHGVHFVAATTRAYPDVKPHVAVAARSPEIVLVTGWRNWGVLPVYARNGVIASFYTWSSWYDLEHRANQLIDFLPGGVHAAAFASLAVEPTLHDPALVAPAL